MAETKKVTSNKKQVTSKAAGKKPAVAAAKKPTPKGVVARSIATKQPSPAAKAAPAKAVVKPVIAKEVKQSRPAENPAVLKKPTADKKILRSAQDDKNRGLRKTRIGKVVSNKMNKTAVVEIINKVPHPLYGKVVVTTTKFKVHDENNECSIGDTVEIMETRPLSRDKYFRLLRIIEKVR